MLQTAEDIKLLNQKIQDASDFVGRINDELSKDSLMVYRFIAKPTR